ncbi:hypothetical protein [Massilia oculi]|uniref:hypothetical protein n=1 Tax=Massilia oculi TaxID=945844 RepID=UPI001AAE5041|nr:hypothetical protein [Massilia oculi]
MSDLKPIIQSRTDNKLIHIKPIGKTTHPAQSFIQTPDRAVNHYFDCSSTSFSFSEKPIAMSIQRYSLSHQLCARIVSMHRTTKAALAIAVDLVALPACFLIAMILRGGDLQLAKQFGPGSYLLVAALTIAAFWLSDLYRAVALLHKSIERVVPQTPDGFTAWSPLRSWACPSA